MFRLKSPATALSSSSLRGLAYAVLGPQRRHLVYIGLAPTTVVRKPIGPQRCGPFHLRKGYGAVPARYAADEINVTVHPRVEWVPLSVSSACRTSAEW